MPAVTLFSNERVPERDRELADLREVGRELSFGKIGSVDLDDGEVGDGISGEHARGSSSPSDARPEVARCLDVVIRHDDAWAPSQMTPLPSPPPISV
jgi:hypothetical protein